MKHQEICGEIYSIRQHHFRFDIQKTFDIYEKLGIKCDVTLGYAQHKGFRAGICLPYQPYSLDEDRPYNVMEIPLTVMDGTLGNSQYEGLTAEQAWLKIESLLASVKRYNGCIVILFHNTYLDVLGHSEYMDLYKRCINFISDNNGLGASPIKISKHLFSFNKYYM